MSIRYRLLCGVAACTAAVASANAQAPAGSQIQTLQQQIQQLQQQLQSLQTQVNEQSQAAAKAAAAAPAPAANAPHVTQSGGNRFGLESADGQYSIALTGRLHFDMGDYLDYHAPKGSAATNLTSGVNVRRARLGLVGRFAGDWDYTFIYDFGGSSDTGAGGFNGGGIENAYVTYNGFKKTNVPVAIDFGYQDTPYSLDEATSSNNIMFMERASSQTIATNFGAGDNRSALGFRYNTDRFWSGIYLTGPVAGAGHTIATDGEQYGVFGRFTYQLLQADDYSLHVGFDALGALHQGTAPQGIALADRPELRIDSTTLFGGTIGGAGQKNPVTSGAVYGGEAAGGWGSWFAQGEYFHYVVDRNGLSENSFDGEYVETSYTLTGEHRKYDPGSGAYSGINPAHPFSLSVGTWGALEAGIRFSEVNLNDALGQPNAFQAGRQDIWTLGLNWYVNPNIRFMFNYLHGDIHRNLTTAGTTPGGGSAGNFDAVATRMQVAF